MSASYEPDFGDENQEYFDDDDFHDYDTNVGDYKEDYEDGDVDFDDFIDRYE